jgi:PBP1b-binding outer membrane lipoprotein LpoB
VEVKMSHSWSLAIVAAVLFLAGCAADPAKPEVASAEKADCRGVAPATGTLLRKKEDCIARAPMTPEEIEEFRRTKVMTQPMVGTGAGR